MTQRRSHHRCRPPPVRPVRQVGRRDGRRGHPVSRSPTPESSWEDIQFGFGGSYEVSNPDSVTRLVGLTGITFTNVFNACATSASAIQQTADTIRLGKYDIGIAIGLDKHPRGAFTDDPAKLALPQWYAENGQFVTTKFFGMKANHYLHKHGISAGDAGQGGQQELPQRCAEPECVPPQGDLRRGDHGVAGAELPVAAVHVLRARRGCRRGHHVPRRPRAQVHRRAGVRARQRDSHPHASAPTRCTPRRRRWTTDTSPTVYAAKAAYEAAGIGPEDVDIAQLQDTDAGAEVIHMAETGLCADGDQEKLLADGATEIGGRAADQHRRRADRQRRAHRRVGSAADARTGPPAARRGRRASGSRRSAGRVWRRSTARPAPRRRPSCRSERPRAGTPCGNAILIGIECDSWPTTASSRTRPSTRAPSPGSCSTGPISATLSSAVCSSNSTRRSSRRRPTTTSASSSSAATGRCSPPVTTSARRS